jgi:hypothetical protein
VRTAAASPDVALRLHPACARVTLARAGPAEWDAHHAHRAFGEFDGVVGAERIMSERGRSDRSSGRVTLRQRANG